jgi:Flp pilus assembly protein TadG
MIRARRQGDRGAVSAELVVATPLLLVLVLLVVQFALWQHAVHVAGAAAQEGARSARLEGGSAAAGQARAEQFLAQLGRTVVMQPQVIVRRDLDRARVEVTGYAVNVLPFIHLPIRAESDGPVERFRPDPALSP